MHTSGLKMVRDNDRNLFKLNCKDKYPANTKMSTILKANEFLNGRMHFLRLNLFEIFWFHTSRHQRICLWSRIQTSQLETVKSITWLYYCPAGCCHPPQFCVSFDLLKYFRHWNTRSSGGVVCTQRIKAAFPSTMVDPKRWPGTFQPS